MQNADEADGIEETMDVRIAMAQRAQRWQKRVEILDMFLQQIPDGNKMAQDVGLGQQSTFFCYGNYMPELPEVEMNWGEVIRRDCFRDED